jgi:hypothetical protein
MLLVPAQLVFVALFRVLRALLESLEPVSAKRAAVSTPSQVASLAPCRQLGTRTSTVRRERRSTDTAPGPFPPRNQCSIHASLISLAGSFFSATLFNHAALSFRAESVFRDTWRVFVFVDVFFVGFFFPHSVLNEIASSGSAGLIEHGWQYLICVLTWRVKLRPHSSQVFNS